jgi:hypothetical protein
MFMNALSSMNSSSQVKNVDSSVNKSSNQGTLEKITEINNVVLANLTSKKALEKEIPPANVGDSVRLSHALMSLIKDIQNEKTIRRWDTLFDILFHYAVIKAEALDLELMAVGVTSSHLSKGFLFLYVHTLFWMCDCLNENTKVLSSLKKNEFFFAPTSYNKENLAVNFMTFNPLEMDVKRHISQHLISLFLISNNRQISWAEFINQPKISSW